MPEKEFFFLAHTKEGSVSRISTGGFSASSHFPLFLVSARAKKRCRARSQKNAMQGAFFDRILCKAISRSWFPEMQQLTMRASSSWNRCRFPPCSVLSANAVSLSDQTGQISHTLALNKKSLERRFSPPPPSFMPLEKRTAAKKGGEEEEV